MEATLLLVAAALLLLAYMLATAIRELSRSSAGPDPAVSSAAARRLALVEAQQLVESLQEVRLGRELGRVDAEDAAQVEAAWREPLALLERESEPELRLARCCRQIEEELARRVGRASPAPPAGPAGEEKAGQPAAARSGPCPSCRRPFRPGDRFCQGCGRTLAGSCSACGTALPEGARFCKRCGRRVD